MRNKLAQKIKLGAALLLMAGTSALAQISNQIYIPTPENIKARQEFQDNKFGIFLHWGIYSMTAQGEWYMNTHNINRDEYAKLASGFYPSRFNAAEWVSAIKTSGAKYICITSRHHDSFSMFDTKESDFNIVDATPFKRDILKELANVKNKASNSIFIIRIWIGFVTTIRKETPDMEQDVPKDMETGQVTTSL